MAAVDNPFAILTAVVAPAILTNACSVLSLGTGNRIARVVDRTRVVSASLEGLEAGHARYSYYQRQLLRLEHRAQLLVRALRLFYFALGGFAASALIAVVGSALTAFDLQLWFQTLAVAGLVTGSSAAACLVYGCALMVRETRLAIENLAESAELHSGSRDPSPLPPA